MDSLSVISALICSLLILSSEGDLMVSQDAANVIYKGAFYAPMFLIAISIPVCAGVSFFVQSSTPIEDHEISSHTANKIRL